MAQFSVNNVSNAVVAAANTTIQLTFYVAAGQTLTITSPSTGVVFISSLESY